MRAVQLKVQLTLRGPVLSRSSSAQQFGLDALAAKDAQGQVYLPYSLIKGALRESWEELEACSTNWLPTSMWFGKAAAARTNELIADADLDVDQSRGRLRFRDFVLVTPKPREHNRTRISIDAERGAADEQQLQVIEEVVAAGEDAVFEGEVSFLSHDEATSQQVTKQLEYAFNWLCQLGMGKSIGFGRVTGIEIAPAKEVQLLPKQVASPAPERVGLTLRFQDPICVSAIRADRRSNMFRSDGVISGGVIRGCIATMLRELRNLPADTELDEANTGTWSTLGKYLSAFHIRHAVPVTDATASRPLLTPFSIVQGNGKVFDVSRSDQPFLIKSQDGGIPLAPAFETDWKLKDFEFVQQSVFGSGYTEPAKDRRVRTAIDTETGHADDGKLFSYEMLLPHTENNTPITWVTELDLIDIPKGDRSQFLAELQGLLAGGLHAVGKTKMTAQCPSPLEEKSRTYSREEQLEAPDYVLCLQTPALMLVPNQNLGPHSDWRDLHKAYQAYFDEVSGQLELVRFFAQQALVGGFIAWQRANREDKPYNPFILSKARSVFVLKPKNSESRDTACEHIKDWKRRNLPLPTAWLDQVYGGSGYKECPYRPQDGFGEITVNLDYHQPPKPDEIEPISLGRVYEN
jgi:hypothetical protein